MIIDDILLARGLHVVGIIFWIGGVAMETTVLLLAMRRTADVDERVRWFKKIERGFVWQARLTTLLVGGTGFYMLNALDAWSSLATIEGLWLHAMILVWVIFTMVLFVLEPLILHQWFERRVERDPDGTFTLIARLHWGLLIVSTLTVFFGVVGAHGGISAS
jgi:uncharacterized membrane protein